MANNSLKTAEDVRVRSKSVPPSKPPPISKQNVDEWEEKLYGKHLGVGRSDSLKRRTWEIPRVTFMLQRDMYGSTTELEHSKSTPNTPDPDKYNRSPFEGTMETEMEPKEGIVEKKRDRRVSKLTFFRREKTDSLETKQLDEQIMAGHYEVVQNSLKTAEDIRLRSKSVPPSKPPRINKKNVDEWEAKLCGKHLGVGRSESLKRRTLEIPRVTFMLKRGISRSDTDLEHSKSPSSTPDPEEHKRSSFECIMEREKEQKEAKKRERRVSKLNYFRREKVDSMENKQFGELNKQELEVNISSKTAEDVRVRSKSVPPSKPPPINKQNVDEWEAKLYGKHLGVGRSDSLKRRTWESPRVTFMLHQDMYESTTDLDRSRSTPNTPDPEEQKRSPLEGIMKKEKEEIVEKKRERRVSKLNYFRRDKTESTERIVVGHEEGRKKHAVEVPQDVLEKYEGKSREELILIVNNVENKIRTQKLEMKEMEDYLDDLILRVMETEPKLLHNI